MGAVRRLTPTPMPTRLPPAAAEPRPPCLLLRNNTNCPGFNPPGRDCNGGQMASRLECDRYGDERSDERWDESSSSGGSLVRGSRVRTRRISNNRSLIPSRARMLKYGV